MDVLGGHGALKIKKNRSREESWEVLGGSWVPRAKNESEGRSETRNWPPKWRPKSIKIASKSDPKGDHFYDRFEDRFGDRVAANLAPSWPSKPAQNGTKLVPKPMQVGVLI